MANARTAWGIDIGNRALKAVKLVREGGEVRIDDFEVIEHEQVLSNAGDNRDSLVQAALASFVQRHPSRGVPVAIGVSGQQSFARFIKLPPVEPKQIPNIVRFEAIQQIPFPLDDVEWSYQLFQSPDSPDVEVGIFAMRKELVGRHISAFTDVDLRVQVVQMSPLAVYNALAYDGRIRDTTMIVDLGAENTDLIITDGQTVWLRSIPIGGNNFTEALVKSFKLNFAKAEELKRNAATSKYARQIFQVMRPVFSDLVSEIQRSIGFYSSVHRDSRIKRVIALGGTFRLPGLQKYLQQNLQLEVERLDTLGDGAPPAGGRSTANFSENALSMVTAYGLALQALGEGRIESSLLPASIRRAQMWQEKTKWFAAAAGLFVLGTGLAFGRLVMEESQMRNAQQASAAEIQRVQPEAQRLDTEWSQVENAGSQDREQLKNLADLLKYRRMWYDILTDIYAALPQSQPQTLQSQPDVVNGYIKGDKDLITKVPRNQREIIVLDDIKSVYVANLSGALGLQAAPGTAMGLGGGSAAQPSDNPRGFIVTLRGTTPNAQGWDFIQQRFVNELRKHSKDAPDPNNPSEWIAPRKGYYIAKAEMKGTRQVRENPARLQAMQQAYQAAQAAQMRPNLQSGGMSGMGGWDPRDYRGGWDMDRGPVDPMSSRGGWSSGVGRTTGRPGETMSNEPFLDRLTGEEVLNDWEFTVEVVVVLDPPSRSESQQQAAAE